MLRRPSARIRAEEEMITVEVREQIRRAYFHENKPIRQIARELRCSRKSIRKALQAAEPAAYPLQAPRPAPVLGPYKPVIDQLLCESHFCPSGEGHEKGGVEHSVGFDRRHFLVPIPQVPSCEAWRRAQPCLRALPARACACCVTRPVTLTPDSQVVFESNRYSVPADQAHRQLVSTAYPFWRELLPLDRVLASHPRCDGRAHALFDPLHYLPLLEQRPGAFDYATPIRRWREGWPPVYAQLLARLRGDGRDGQGVRACVRLLRLHRDHPAAQVEQAIRLALQYGCGQADGVALCLQQVQHPTAPGPALDLPAQPRLAPVGTQPVEVGRYEQRLTGGTSPGTRPCA